MIHPDGHPVVDYQWVAAHKKQQQGGLSFEEREELAELRRENRRLKME